MKRLWSRWTKGLAAAGLVMIVLLASGGMFGELCAKDEAYDHLKLFTDVLYELENNYVEPVDPAKLVDSAIEGMVTSLDPHSAFMKPEAFKSLQEDTKGQFGGIGIVITKRDGLLTVISPIPDTPAYRAGVRAKDVIIKVDGEPTRDMMLEEAVKRMRGEPGTTVHITIVRQGVKKPLEFDLVRAIIPMDSVKYAVVKPGFGYLWITNFRATTEAEVKNALKEMESGDVPLKGLILDLRDNPGGLLDQAVAVADIFLDSGRIVTIRGRDPKDEEVYTAHPNPPDERHDYPVVLLVNAGSASASEIVAGALQDNHRALLIGTDTFGKGSVQTVKPLRDGYGLKYTVALYYTPSGRSIQADGVHPDLVVQHHYIDEAEEQNPLLRRIKEEDLRNHLPGAREERKDDKGDTSGGQDIGNDLEKKNDQEKAASEIEKLMRLKDVLYKDSGGDPAELLKDSQVNRAYEILKGYEIFQAYKRASGD